MSEFITPLALAQRIHSKTGINADLAKRFSYEFFSIARRVLNQDSAFIIHRFGTFKKIWIEQSTGRNPQTNTEIIIPSHWRIKFTPAKATADRINKRYAHLKAKLIKNSPAKEENESLSEFFQSTQILNPDTVKTEELENDPDDFIDDNEEEKKSSSLPYFIGLGVLAILALFVFCLFLVKQCKPATKSKVIKQAEPVAAEPDTTPQQTPAPPKEVSLLEYSVPSGSCYYKIAEEQFENRHVWPIIYAQNIQANPDPDLVNAYAKIFIPSKEVLTQNIQNAKDSYLQTYNAYYSIIKVEPENAKNPLRQFRAVRVLVSGEIMFPGFIEEYKGSVSEQDYKDALAIYKNYRP